MDQRQLHGLLPTMVQDEELFRRQRGLSVGPTFVIGKLYLVGPVQQLDDGTDVPSAQAMEWQVGEESDDV